MYQIGDQVVYGFHGVCRIVDMEKRVVDRKTVRYYVLEPRDQSNARFYIPTENQAAVSKLRPVLSREELDEILARDSIWMDAWIVDKNTRKQRYRELINSGDWAALLTMVYTLYRHRREQKAAGRKFHLCDENFLRDAEKLICSEVSVVMEIPAEEVPDFLMRQMKTT